MRRNSLDILNILKKYTDKNHALSAPKIAIKLKEEYGNEIDEKTVRRHINNLVEEFGYDIVNSPTGYYYQINPDEEFDPTELNAIINTFAYSNFIPESMSNEIIDKCLNMMNVYEQDKYKDYKAIMKDTKTDNYNIFNNIEDLNRIIAKKKQIMIEYEHYMILEDKLDKSINVLTLSPYKVIYALQKFYLICYNHNTKQLCSKRLDKIKKISVQSEKVKDISEGEIEFFIKNNVNMISGDLVKVEIECNNSILDMVVETYGKDIKLQALPNDKFYASFETNIQGFKYWCLRNYDNVTVLTPSNLLKDIKKLVEDK